MNSSQEIPGELIVSGCYAPEVLKPAEAALDDISAFVGTFVEVMDDDPVGFIGNYGLGSAAGDFGAEVVAIVALVGEERAHGWSECQNIGRSNDVGILTWSQMKDDRPAERIAQRMDLCRAPTARSADRLIVLPPFRRRHNDEL
jgi:hypothetical protein